jgi:hypothetical protein
MGQIRVGTAGWTDRSLIATGWYPAEVFNNCYSDYAHVNAQQFTALVS